MNRYLPYLKSKQAFISVITLFFISVFLLFSFNDYTNQPITDFIIIDQAETQKTVTINDVERIISNHLTITEDNPIILKDYINQNLINYLEQKEFFVYNKITKEKKEITLLELNNLSRVIVFKPNEHVIIKKYILTNDIFKSDYLSFEINTNKYKTDFSFPEEYEVQIIEYK